LASFQVEEWLKTGIAAARKGDHKRAYELLLKVVDVDEYNEQAWLWLSSVVDTDTDREVCLENVLAINPDNKVAKAGLVHLRTKGIQPDPEPDESEEEPSVPPQPVRPVETTTAGAQSPEIEGEPESELPGQDTVEATPEEDTETTWPAHHSEYPRESFLERWGVPGMLVLGILFTGIALAAWLAFGRQDPAATAYVQAIRPLLSEYEAWWAGPQGELVDALNGLCGPDSGGWRNRDVLLVCSRYPEVDCGRLAAHCGTDIEAMRTHIVQLSRQAQQEAQSLLAALDDLTPPEEIAPTHAHLIGCIEAEMAGAARANRLAQGGAAPTPDTPSVCTLYPAAEQELKAYVGSP
jgi:hypothetical protein